MQKALLHLMVTPVFFKTNLSSLKGSEYTFEIKYNTHLILWRLVYVLCAVFWGELRCNLLDVIRWTGNAKPLRAVQLTSCTVWPSQNQINSFKLSARKEGSEKEHAQLGFYCVRKSKVQLPPPWGLESNILSQRHMAPKHVQRLNI